MQHDGNTRHVITPYIQNHDDWSFVIMLQCALTRQKGGLGSLKLCCSDVAATRWSLPRVSRRGFLWQNGCVVCCQKAIFSEMFGKLHIQARLWVARKSAGMLEQHKEQAHSHCLMVSTQVTFWALQECCVQWIKAGITWSWPSVAESHICPCSETHWVHRGDTRAEMWWDHQGSPRNEVDEVCSINQY